MPQGVHPEDAEAVQPDEGVQQEEAIVDMVPDYDHDTVTNDEEMVDATIVPITMHVRENPMIKKHGTFAYKQIY